MPSLGLARDDKSRPTLVKTRHVPQSRQAEFHATMQSTCISSHCDTSRRLCVRMNGFSGCTVGLWPGSWRPRTTVRVLFRSSGEVSHLHQSRFCVAKIPQLFTCKELISGLVLSLSCIPYTKRPVCANLIPTFDHLLWSTVLHLAPCLTLEQCG